MAETLGDRLKAAMKAKRVSNAKVAAAAGVHPVTVSQWRSDKQEPEDDALVRAAVFLGVSPAFLRYGAEPISLSGAPAVAEAVAMPGQLFMSGQPEAVKLPAPRLSPAVYMAVTEYLEALEGLGFNAESVAYVEQLLRAFLFCPLFPTAVKDRTDNQMLGLLRLIAGAIRQGLTIPTGYPKEREPAPGESPPQPRAAVEGRSVPASRSARRPSTAPRRELAT